MEKEGEGLRDDRREIFDRLIVVESKLDNLTENLKNFTDKAPCKEHFNTMKGIEVQMEKNKHSMLTSAVAFVISALTLVVAFLGIGTHNK